jgi:7-cyano-7-deazaguanine synthase
MSGKNTPAVILLSGGLDSATVMAMAREKGHRLHALSFAYGQRHDVELEAAKKVASSMNCDDHAIVNLDLGRLVHSALTGQVEVPKYQDDEGAGDSIPVTYVPARNIIFLAYAAARAETVGARDIYLGVNAVDYSGYPDCRPEFIDAFGKALDLGTKQGVEGNGFRIHTPLIDMTKAEIIKEGVRLGVDYAITHSCYDPDWEGHACGHCDSCLLRKKGFVEAGVADPTAYSGC